MTTDSLSVRERMRAAASSAATPQTSTLASAAPQQAAETTPLAMLQELVRQLNEEAGLSLTTDEAGYCLMESLHGLPIMICLHDEGTSLLLSAELGEIPGDPAVAGRILLEANAFGRSTLGGCFGLLPGKDSLVYQYVFQDLSRCPARVLLPVLSSFVAHGEKVRNLIAAGDLGQLNPPLD